MYFRGADDQGFNWESSKKGGWYNSLRHSVPQLATSGITHVWLPPPSDAISLEATTHNILMARGTMTLELTTMLPLILTTKTQKSRKSFRIG
ncbi:hypothetical protein PRUPE_8G125300 [Prunus persica]|uniref:Uncharacterized protein n=1 Tax=Prunus persica TaxID=3760 RepID=A0A251MWW7_PRUPE|nr:hypothetical protein PRUPE_8G125300 [Prunus persica]